MGHPHPLGSSIQNSEEAINDLGLISPIFWWVTEFKNRIFIKQGFRERALWTSFKIHECSYGPLEFQHWCWTIYYYNKCLTRWSSQATLTGNDAWSTKLGVSPLPWIAVTTHCKITARLEGDRAMVLRLVEINKFLFGIWGMWKEQVHSICTHVLVIAICSCPFTQNKLLKQTYLIQVEPVPLPLSFLASSSSQGMELFSFNTLYSFWVPLYHLVFKFALKKYLYYS